MEDFMNKDSWLDLAVDEATEALGKRDDVITFDEVLINVPKLKHQLLQAIKEKIGEDEKRVHPVQVGKPNLRQMFDKEQGNMWYDARNQLRAELRQSFGIERNTE